MAPTRGRRTLVVVGDKKTLGLPTPMIASVIYYVVHNPYWNVPRSIELGEIVPKLARDPDYLRKHDMELVARGGALGRRRVAEDRHRRVLRRRGLDAPR